MASGAAEARALLDELAQGDPEAWLTHEARVVQRRLTSQDRP